VVRRVLALTFLGLALVTCVAFAATESLTNRTGRTATAVTVTFSEQVRITSYDQTVFPTKDPSSRSDTFRFSGGQLENGARFSVSWTPSGATIESYEWVTEPDLNGPLQVGAEWDQRRVDRINRVIDELNSIELGGLRDYDFALQHDGGVQAEGIIGAISDLAILTLGVESYATPVTDPVIGVDETILGGEFGEFVRKTLLGYNPGSELLRVYNEGTFPDAQGNRASAYTLSLPGRIYIAVQLSPTLARAGGGCNLGVFLISNQQAVDTESVPAKIRCYELLFEHPNAEFLPELDPASWIASCFHYSKLDNAENTILEIEGWLFAEGNPNPIIYRPLGPP
jgi:hypothetical protein